MILLVLIIARKAMSKYDTKSGYKIVILVTWILFVMINAYFRFVGQSNLAVNFLSSTFKNSFLLDARMFMLHW